MARVWAICRLRIDLAGVLGRLFEPLDDDLRVNWWLLRVHKHLARPFTRFNGRLVDKGCKQSARELA